MDDHADFMDHREADAVAFVRFRLGPVWVADYDTLGIARDLRDLAGSWDLSKASYEQFWDAVNRHHIPITPAPSTSRSRPGSPSRLGILTRWLGAVRRG